MPEDPRNSHSGHDPLHLLPDHPCDANPNCSATSHVHTLYTTWPLFLLILPDTHEANTLSSEYREIQHERTWTLSTSPDSSNPGVHYVLAGRMFFRNDHYTAEILQGDDTLLYNDMACGGVLRKTGDWTKCLERNVDTLVYLYIRTSTHQVCELCLSFNTRPNR